MWHFKHFVFVTSNTLYDSQKALELIFVSNYLVFSIMPICWLRSISSISCFCSVFSRPTICLMKTCWRRSNTLGLSSKSFIRHLKGTQAKNGRICAKMSKIPHQMAADKDQIQEKHKQAWMNWDEFSYKQCSGKTAGG